MTTSGALAIALLYGQAAAAQKLDGFAASSTHQVGAQAEYWVDLSLCSANVIIDARGDNSGDVDYTIYDVHNASVYQNIAVHDDMLATISTTATPDACLPYRMVMRNLGDRPNRVQLAIIEARPFAPEQISYYDVAANGTFNVDLNLCAPFTHISGVGNGTTDVDYVVTDRNGAQVEIDTGGTDRGDLTIAPPSVGTGAGTGAGRCTAYRLTLSNLGQTTNRIALTVQDLVRQSASQPINR